ncbi:MAG TPA: hypothetical protein VLA04_04960 [Verrucomicrobiae bacterium]|nr:hypothetical protein [Verrucomicrobiae bacterium]
MFNKSKVSSDLEVAKKAAVGAIKGTGYLTVIVAVVFIVCAILFYAGNFLGIGLEVLGDIIALVAVGYGIVWLIASDLEDVLHNPPYFWGAIAAFLVILIWFRAWVPPLLIILALRLLASRWIDTQDQRETFGVLCACVLLLVPQALALYALRPIRRTFIGYRTSFNATLGDQEATKDYLPYPGEVEWLGDNEILNARDEATRRWGLTPIYQKWWYSGRYDRLSINNLYILNPFRLFEDPDNMGQKAVDEKPDRDYSY